MSKALLTFLIGSVFGAIISSGFIFKWLKDADTADPKIAHALSKSDKALTVECPIFQSQVNYAIQQKLQEIVLPQIENTIQQEVAKLANSALSHTENIKEHERDKEKVQEHLEYAEQILSSIEVAGFIDQSDQDAFDIAISKLPAKQKYQLDLELARKINSGQITLED